MLRDELLVPFSHEEMKREINSMTEMYFMASIVNYIKACSIFYGNTETLFLIVYIIPIGFSLLKDEKETRAYRDLFLFL
jgi:hypothetical protein